MAQRCCWNVVPGIASCGMFLLDFLQHTGFTVFVVVPVEYKCPHDAEQHDKNGVAEGIGGEFVEVAFSDKFYGDIADEDDEHQL